MIVGTRQHNFIREFDESISLLFVRVEKQVVDVVENIKNEKQLDLLAWMTSQDHWSHDIDKPFENKEWVVKNSPFDSSSSINVNSIIP